MKFYIGKNYKPGMKIGIITKWTIHDYFSHDNARWNFRIRLPNYYFVIQIDFPGALGRAIIKRLG